MEAVKPEIPVLTKIQKFCAVAAGALIMGSLWRLRGEHGWGGSWGLLTVASAFLLLVFALFGNRRKGNFLTYSVTAAAMMLTTPGWGTINRQITGVLTGVAEGTGETLTVAVSPLSALFLMLCLGFGLSTVFAFMLGRFFSGRRYNAYEFLIILFVFYAVRYLARAFVSPFILQAVQPQAAELFSAGLREAGIAGDPWRVYLQHFWETAKLKQIIGGRNYASSVSVIASAIDTLAVAAITRFVFKDKTGTRILLGICAAFAAAITLSDMSLYMTADGGLPLPGIITGWSIWEYFTGFFAGGFIMLLLVCLPVKRLEQSTGVEDSILPKPGSAAYKALNVLFTLVFVFSVSLIRPAAGRNDDRTIELYILLGAAAAAAVAAIALKKGPGLENVDFRRFCVRALPVYYGVNAVLYLFVGTPDCRHIRHLNDFANVLFLLSVLLFIPLYFVLFGRSAELSAKPGARH